MAESYSIQAVLSAVDKNFASTMQKATGTTDDLDKGMQKTNTSILDIAKGVGVFKLVDIGVSAVTNSLGAAISRFDTLNQYPKVLQSLGASAEDSDRGIQILSDGIDGLPTKLDDVAATSQQMFLTFRDADKASESTIALNNALLASGSSGDKAARGTDAYIKMLRLGKVDMDTWQSLQETMGIGLDKVAKEMLGAEASTNDLYKALQSGQISIDEFNSALVGMSDELGDLARTNTKGIGTSFSNMANSISKGVANSIKSLDNLVKTSGINADGIAGIFDVLKGQINNAFNTINKAIEGASPYVEGFIGVVSKLSPLIPPLTVALAGTVAVFGTLKVIGTVNGLLGTFGKVTVSSTIATNAFDATLKKAEKSTIMFKVAQLAVKGAAAVVTGTITGLKVAYQLLTRQTTIGAVAQSAFAGGTTLLSTAIKGLYAALGPVGVAMGVIAAVGATVAWVYKTQTKASKELNKQQDELLDSLTSSSDAYDKSIEKTVSQSKMNQQLKDEVVDLAIQENKSAETKELLKTKVDELNSKVQGLGLAYNEEADGITMSNEQIQKRIDLQEKQAMGNAAEEQLIELQVKRKEATENLKKAEENKQLVDEKTIKFVSDIKNSEEAVTKAKQYRDSVEEQIAQATITRENGLKASAEELTLVHDEMVEQGKINYQSLNDTQKTAFDSMQTTYNSLLSTTTSVFDQIEQKQTISLAQMTENLRKNEEAMRVWSDNVKILSERGVDEGIIAQLEKMGPAGAQQAARLVQETSDELGNLTPEGKAKIDEMNSAMSGAMKETTSGMTKIVGEGSEPFATEWEKVGKAGMTSLKGSFKASDLQQLGNDVNTGIAESLGNSSGQVEEAASNVVKKLENPFDSLKPKFYETGKEVPNGLSKGITDNSKLVNSASKDLGDGVDKNVRDSLGIHSPSRVMVENGAFVIAGLVQGMQQGQSSVLSIANTLANTVKEPFANLPNTMQSLGYNAGVGFANGLASSSGSIYSTANSIANNVARTIQSALDIHSPSRVMMKLGGFVGEGLAIGMKKSAKMVNTASETLAQATIPDASTMFGSDINNGGRISLDFTLQLMNSQFRKVVDDITAIQNGNIRLDSSI